MLLETFATVRFSDEVRRTDGSPIEVRLNFKKAIFIELLFEILIDMNYLLIQN